MRLDVDACCDIGCVRKNNEDMILVGMHLLRDAAFGDRVESPGRLVMAVADGMGGAAAGEHASEYALSRLAAYVQAAPAGLDAADLCGVLELWAYRTHAELLEQGRQDPQRAGMGTTVVGLLLVGGRAWRFHAGDSRLYRRRDGVLERLTQDHSFRQASGDALAPASLLVNAIGGGNESQLECVEIPDGVKPLDRFLLCSDGLTEMVNDDHIDRALRADRETATRMLVHMAREAGGLDNISVLIADVPRATAPQVSSDQHA